jgi:hypothetical protein
LNAKPYGPSITDDVQPCGAVAERVARGTEAETQPGEGDQGVGAVASRSGYLTPARAEGGESSSPPPYAL